ncbi:MAG TPA: DsrE family protein [Longimicrobiales bacterium]|nr:DsrE family protein [Longimicrobiales bacterium]
MTPRSAITLLLACGLAATARAQHAPATSSEDIDQETPMIATSQQQRILVHVTHGPEAPTRAALAFNVARSALQQGHEVTLFLAGDAVQLIRDDVLDHLAGLGTGSMRQLYDGIVSDGGTFFLSGGSSNARGVTEADLTNKPATFAGPDQLVRLALEHDRMFTY